MVTQLLPLPKQPCLCSRQRASCIVTTCSHIGTNHGSCFGRGVRTTHQPYYLLVLLYLHSTAYDFECVDSVGFGQASTSSLELVFFLFFCKVSYDGLIAKVVYVTLTIVL